MFNFSDELARKQLKKLPVLPTSALKEHPSISYWYAKTSCHIVIQNENSLIGDCSQALIENLIDSARKTCQKVLDIKYLQSVTAVLSMI